MFNYIIIRISRILQSELRKLCSVDSLLKENLTTAFQEFSWNYLIKEIQDHAPLLLSVMTACTKTRSYRPNRNTEYYWDVHCHAVEVSLQKYVFGAKDFVTCSVCRPF